MSKIKRIAFNPAAVIDGGRDHVTQLHGSECSVTLEASGHLVRVRVPEKRVDFAVPAHTCTIEYEWEGDAAAEAQRFQPPANEAKAQGKFRG